MKTKSNVVDLTQKLVAIPSWVDAKTNEAEIGEFCFSYLKKNKKLMVEKQIVDGNRFNIIARNSDVVDTLVVGHIDTVQPSLRWKRSPTKPEVARNKLYGLGSCDMKSGIAIMLDLASAATILPRTMFLFYIDEEYTFKGIKAFIKKYKSKINPKRVISLDGSDLSITNGCRGLIEISCTIKGQSGHAARPENGKNAIWATQEILQDLFGWLDTFSSSQLGKTSYNIAYISGGQYQGKDENEELILGKQGNVIADICNFIIDIRPSSSKLSAESVLEFIQKRAEAKHVSVESYSITHDLGSWQTEKDAIESSLTTLPFKKPDETGYIDVQMIWQAFDGVPCFTIGAGKVDMAHKPDEYVEIDKLIKLREMLNKMIIYEC